jgi:hypothetical protein
VTRILRIIAWLALGHAIVGALCWALLQVPESTMWTLASSLLLGVLILVIAAIVESLAVLAWLESGPGPLGRRTPHVVATTAVRAVAGFVVAALLFAAVWWLAGRADGWWTARRGEIDAWLMMKTRSPRTGLLHAAVSWGLWVVQYPVALALAVAVLASMLDPIRSVPIHRRLSATLGWRPILGLSLTLILFVMLPWRYVYWRPASLPANWLEPAFVGVKLAVVYVLLNTGWAIALSAAARVPRVPRAPQSAPAPPPI